MSLATRIESLVIRVAQEFNDVRAKAGNLANLTTTDKSNLVAAINELKAAVVSSAVIDDAHVAEEPRKIIHVDIDPSSISKRVRVDTPIVGDVKEVLDEMIRQIESGEARPNPEALASWWKQIEQWRERKCMVYKNSDEIIKPQFLIQKLWEVEG